eukprot:TRINITY_DN6837_c0_g1_i2.p1 TRINITY_DN6837_c0_g1~~TRINITY_DN6837_c0_g1_i2.p1  ORF type:complete len:535 (+),score=110.14 TRINITY_DN6837_c0_g1_i2:165-1607(+)
MCIRDRAKHNKSKALTPSQVAAANLAVRHHQLSRGTSQATHLDERNIAANGRLLSKPGIKQMVQRHQDSPAAARAAPRAEAQVLSKPRRADEWQPRALHLGRTHKHSDSTLRTFHGHCRDVMAVTIHRDFMFTSSKDRTVRMFDLVTGEPMHVFSGHTDWVTDVAVCDKESKTFPQTDRALIMLSASADRTVRCWDATTGECFRVLPGGHEESLTSVVTAGSQVFTGSADHTIACWNPESARVTGRLIGHAGTVWALHVSGRMLFSCSDDLTARQWNRKTLQPVRTFSGHTGSVLGLTTVLGGADGFGSGMLCTVSEDGSLRVWHTGSDEDDGGKCCAMARGFEAAEAHGELRDTVTIKGRNLRKSEHVRAVSGWQWMGTLHSVSADNKSGVIYTGSASGVICEFDLNQTNWEELEGTDGVLELVRNAYYFCKPHQDRKGRKEGSSVYSLAYQSGYLLAGSEDNAVHEFWVNREGRQALQ